MKEVSHLDIHFQANVVEILPPRRFFSKSRYGLLRYLIAIMISITGTSVVNLPPASAATSTVNCGNGGYFTIDANVVTSQSNCKGTVEIPTGVTSIAASAFSQLGKTSTTGWNYITSVTISNSVTSIGAGAFTANKAMTTLTLGSALVSIGTGAFYDCWELLSLVIPNSVTTIGDQAFEHNKKLNSITIGTGVTYLGHSALRGTAITTLDIPDSVITIGAWFMQSTQFMNAAKSLTSLKIGSGVTSIGEGAFPDAVALTYLVLGNNVTSLGVGSISYTNLTSYKYCGTLSASSLASAGLATNSSGVPITKTCPTPVTFSDWPNVSKAFGASNFTLMPATVTGSVSGTWAYVSATPSVISLSGTTATVGSAGTSVITGTFTPSDTNAYSAGVKIMTVTVDRAKPTFTSPPGVTKIFGNPSFALTAPTVTGGVLGTFAYSSGSPSVISISGSTATVVGAGTSAVTATFTPSNTTNYFSGETTTITVSVTQGSQTSALVLSSTIATFGADLTLTTTGGSGGGAVTYARDSGPCSISGSTFTPTSAGTCYVTATMAANGNYLAANSASTAITIRKFTPIFQSWIDASATYGDSNFDLTAPTVNGSILGIFTYSSATTSVATVSGNTLTVIGAGTSVITATFTPSDATNYLSGGTTTMTVRVGQISQLSTLAISSIAATYGSNLTLATTGGSGSGLVTYVRNSGPCTILGSTLTPTGVGTCYVTATKATSGNYLANNSVSTAITINQITPTFLTWSGVPKTFGNPSFTLTSPTSSTPGTWLYSSATTSVVTVSGDTVTIIGVGTSVITATFTPSDVTNYLSSGTASMTITVGQATPTVSLALSTANPIYGSVDTVTATAQVQGTFTFKSSGATIAGCENVVTSASSPYLALCNWTPNAVTSYSISASFTPNNVTDYQTSTAPALTPTSGKAVITVTPTAGQSKVYLANNPTIAYSITSGSLVEPDVLSGDLMYTGTNVSSYPITIGSLANSNYTITLAPVNFTITQATQAAVTLSSISAAYNPSNKTAALTGTGGSGTGFYSTSLDSSNTTPGCLVSGTILTYTTSGTCVIAVTRLSDTNYLARIDVVSFSIGLASQTITFGSLSAKNYSADTFTVSATSSASLTVVFTSASQSVCTTSGTSGSTVTLLSVGTCVINANQIGEASVSPASQVSQNFTVNPRAITATADAKTKVFEATDPTFTYTITTGSLVLGDVITGTLKRATGTDVGDYQIQQGTLTTATNPKYEITFVSADLSITRATPTLVLTYPNSNVAILRPGAVDTPTVTTSSSSGALTFATSAASSICTVDTTTGVISFFGAGSCPVAMSTAITANFFAHTETTTVTVALLSTSLVGINAAHLVSMGQPFFSHASIDQSYSFSSGSSGASVAIPAGTLDPAVPISINLLTDSADQRVMIGGTGISVLSVVVSWVAPDGSVPNTNTGKAISVTLTNPAIKNGAKVYSIIGNQSRLLGTAATDGSVTTLITEDPVLLVINPEVVAARVFVSAPTSVDNSAALKIAAEAKVAEEAVALKAAQEKMAADAKALAEAKAAADAAAIKAAQAAADASAKVAAALQAAKDAEIAAANAAKAIKPAVTLYSLSYRLKLSVYDSAYITKYVKSLKNGASVTCIGYGYSKNTTVKKATALAKSQATAVCALMKKTNKTLKTSVVVYPVTKAPKAAKGAKWVGVSYRIDGFKAK